MADDSDVFLSLDDVLRGHPGFKESPDDPPCYPGYAAFKRWLKHELSLYLARAGDGATRDGFSHHACQPLPTIPETRPFDNKYGYLDCGDLDAVIEAVWNAARSESPHAPPGV